MAPTPTKTLVFRISCWFLGVLAFAQIITSVVALAMRMEDNRTVKVVDKDEPAAPTVIVDQPLAVAPLPVTPSTKQPATVPAVLPPVETPEPVVVAPLPPPRPLETPRIADPVTERLVQEAKAARVSEDMMSAITKLEQALVTSPRDTNVMFELGLCHEAMGIYDKARQYYHQVYLLGTSGAGALYIQAADKLQRGFEQPADKINRIVLGRVRVFKDPQLKNGQKVIITIPVQCVPGEQIENRDLEVRVNFFDEVGARKEITAADMTRCKTETKWVTEPLDWGSGEELLQVSYTIPKEDQQQEHLFGDKHYYGQVVELSYKGELIDAQAWPRILAHKLNKPDAAPVFLDQQMPQDYNPLNPLLPNAPVDELSPATRPDYSKQDLPPPPPDFPPDNATPLPVPPEYQNLPQQ